MRRRNLLAEQYIRQLVREAIEEMKGPGYGRKRVEDLLSRTLADTQKALEDIRLINTKSRPERWGATEVQLRVLRIADHNIQKYITALSKVLHDLNGSSIISIPPQEDVVLRGPGLSRGKIIELLHQGVVDTQNAWGSVHCVNTRSRFERWGATPEQAEVLKKIEVGLFKHMKIFSRLIMELKNPNPEDSPN